MLFSSERGGPIQIWQRDLANGKESLAVSGSSELDRGIQAHSGRIYYRAVTGSLRWTVNVLDPSTGEARTIVSADDLWDIDPNEEMATVEVDVGNRATTQVVDLKSGRHVSFLSNEHWSIYQAHFSADNRWVVFLAITGPSKGQIFAARPRGMQEISRADWLTVTDGKAEVDKPRFSPDGKLVYFTQEDQGSRSIQAVRFDREKGATNRESFLVYDFPSPRLSMLPVTLAALEMDVARDKIVVLLAESNFNIWTMDLGIPHLW